jgi:hypothetical protein
MPTSPTYPGVYIEEIPSGVRAIRGVATSITAFVGRALRGPLDEPVTLNGFADFERVFGGLWVDSALGFAVRAFFDNGGGQAIVVRVAKGAKAAKLVRGAAALRAASEGAWGDGLRLRVSADVSDEAAARFGLAKADMFNLQVRDGVTGRSERHLNVTFKNSPRRLDRVLANESELVRYDGPALTGAETVPSAHGDPAAGKTIWEDDSASSKVENADKGADGDPLEQGQFDGDEAGKKGLYALEKADLFNLLVLPPYKQGTSGLDVDSGLWAKAAAYCEKRRAFLLVDPLSDWNTKDKAKAGVDALSLPSNHAALYFPRLVQANPLRQNQPEEVVPSGALAGIFARTDAQRGVWKAPAGLAATLNGVAGLSVSLTDPENGELNPKGVNCLRFFPGAGRVVWGARTLRGDDSLADDYKYVPVRRTALFLEESLYRGLKWVVFEPNDEPLWAQIRMSVGAFLQGLFRQGAFQGRTPREAYFVKCDRETTTQADIDLGIVNIVVGFAPLKPAEFVIVKLQQMAGQTEA